MNTTKKKVFFTIKFLVAAIILFIGNSLHAYKIHDSVGDIYSKCMNLHTGSSTAYSLTLGIILLVRTKCTISLNKFYDVFLKYISNQSLLECSV